MKIIVSIIIDIFFNLLFVNNASNLHCDTASPKLIFIKIKKIISFSLKVSFLKRFKMNLEVYKTGYIQCTILCLNNENLLSL